MRHPFTLLAAALLPFACSDTVSTGGLNTGAPVTVDTLTTEYTRAACSSLFLCPGSGDTATTQALFESPALCVERVRSFAGTELDDLTAALRAGRIRLDGAVARRCLDYLTTHCAANDLDLSEFCAEALQGTVAAGGGCWRSQECVRGNFCDHGDPAARMCPGTCRAQLAPGSACTLARQCLASTGRTARCESGRCVDASSGPDAAENAQCGTIPAGTNAVSVVGCAMGLYCAALTNGVGTCRRVLTEGSPCTRADGCSPGLACVASVGTTTTTCRRVTVVDVAGGACDARGQTGFCNPLVGLRCGAAMTCERPGDGTMNARCQRGDLFLSCNSGLYCNATSMTCQAKLAVGATCEADGDCTSGECGDGPNRRCLERVCN